MARRAKRAGKSKKPLVSGKTLVICAILAAVVAALAYSISFFYSSGSAEGGIVVCDPNNQTKCLWQDHIHVMVVMTVDGRQVDLPPGVGELNRPHTHDETNIIHWHASLPYDPATGKVLNDSDFHISNSLQSLGVEMPVGGRLFYDRGGAWKLAPDYYNFVWQDRDIVYILNDSRTDDAVLSYLGSANIQLPYLGAG